VELARRENKTAAGQFTAAAPFPTDPGWMGEDFYGY